MQGLIDKWLQVDVNPVTRSQILELATDISGNHDKLDELLSKRIVFGTAGLRSKMEAGFNRINDVTVLQTSQGLAAYILKHKVDEDPSIVIGHDHRHNSKKFAEIAIASFLIKGFKVYYIGSDVVATPMVPFAVDKFKSSAGIMITASHNPKDDNGYKVYWSNGCQIIPPHDSNIQNEILSNLTPCLKNDWDTKYYFDKYNENLIYCYDEIVNDYSNHLISLLDPESSLSFKFVYTAMHGVGTKFVKNLLDKIGIDIDTNFIEVVEQCNPDPEFPTVKFPNPEEKGALNLAIETANKFNDVKLILSNDPDADRFTAAFKNDENKWIQLSGNEIGILFTDYVINSEYIDLNKSLNDVYILNSTVSSQMIESMAKISGFKFKDTLTGFKWIGNEAINLEGKGFEVPFAYEEAIGFMFKTVHDKDGISALLVFLKLYHRLLTLGTNPIDKLKELYLKYGYFKQCNGYYITKDPLIISKIFNETIRAKNVEKNCKYPSKIGDYKVIYWRDLTTGFDSSILDNIPELFVDEKSQMITCKVVPLNDPIPDNKESEYVRFTVRGSGTEPKLKVYIEAKSDNEDRAQHLAADMWDTLSKEWFQPEENKIAPCFV